jgi:hypothetical protein
MRVSLFQITTFTEPTTTREESAEPSLQLEKASPIPMSTYHHFFKQKRQGSAYILVIVKILLAAVYKSPGCAWNDADITQLLSLDENLF